MLINVWRGEQNTDPISDSCMIMLLQYSLKHMSNHINVILKILCMYIIITYTWKRKKIKFIPILVAEKIHHRVWKLFSNIKKGNIWSNLYIICMEIATISRRELSYLKQLFKICNIAAKSHFGLSVKDAKSWIYSLENVAFTLQIILDTEIQRSYVSKPCCCFQQYYASTCLQGGWKRPRHHFSMSDIRLSWSYLFFLFFFLIETHWAGFVLICFCHSVFLGISSPGLIYILIVSI